ncbi:outer membrane protein [Methylocystis sp. S23]|jgi:outer membrane immunogenic protein
MKKIALSFAALALTAGSALAADLPSRKGPPILPPPPPPPPLWTGFYVGLNAGGTFGNSSNITTFGAPIFVNPLFPAGAGAVANSLAFAATSNLSGGNNSGFIGGGQIGYNYQFYNSFVVGLEADIQGIAGSNNTSTGAGVVSLGPWGFPAESYAAVSSARRNIDYLGTVRGRLGWLALPTLLIYGTGGLAYGGVNVNTAFTAQESLGAAVYPTVFGGANFSDTRVGWTAGGGVEWMFWPNWSAKVEYLYYDLGTVTTNGVVAQINNTLAPPQVWGAAATQTTTRFDGHIVRAGVNYHFNWGAPAPVVAKY